MIGLVALALAAEALSAPLTLPKTARVEMTVERTREDVRGGQTKSASSFARYDKTIEAQGEGYRVTLKPVEIKPPQLPSAAEQAKLQAAMEGLANRTFVYTADESLAPQAMEDWPGVVTEMGKALTAMVGDTPEGRQALTAILPMFERMSPRQAAATFLKEDGFLALPVNAELEAGKPHTYQDVLPNPLGGPPIKANGVVALERIDTARGVAVVRWTQSLDPQSTRESMAVALKGLAAKLAPKADTPEARATIDSIKLERTNGCLYEVDLKSGLPVKADCDSKILSSDPTGQTAARNERWVITQTLKN